MVWVQRHGHLKRCKQVRYKVAILYPIAPPYKSTQNPICHKNKPFFIKNTKRTNNFSFPHLYLNAITDGAHTKKRERATKVSCTPRRYVRKIISKLP